MMVRQTKMLLELEAGNTFLEKGQFGKGNKE